jgi:hypothetical protein
MHDIYIHKYKRIVHDLLWLVSSANRFYVLRDIIVIILYGAYALAFAHVGGDGGKTKIIIISMYNATEYHRRPARTGFDDRIYEIVVKCR